MTSTPPDYGALGLAAFRRQWATSMEMLPAARELWHALRDIYPAEDDRLRWLQSPNRALPDSVSPSYLVHAGRAEEALALVERIASGAGS